SGPVVQHIDGFVLVVHPGLCNSLRSTRQSGAVEEADCDRGHSWPSDECQALLRCLAADPDVEDSCRPAADDCRAASAFLGLGPDSLAVGILLRGIWADVELPSVRRSRLLCARRPRGRLESPRQQIYSTDVFELSLPSMSSPRPDDHMALIAACRAT